MTENEDQSIFSRVSQRESHHRDYPLRNFDRKLGLVYYDDDSSDEEYVRDQPKVKVYRSWSADHRTDSDPEYSPSEFVAKKILTRHAHSSGTCETLHQQQPPIPKVILKRSYSSVRKDAFSASHDIRRYNSKRKRGRPRKYFCLNNSGPDAHKTSKNESLYFTRRRGRPKNYPFVNQSYASLSGTHKNYFYNNSRSTVYKRGRPRTYSCLNNIGHDSHKTSQNESLYFTRKRGRPRKFPFVNQTSESLSGTHKNHVNNNSSSAVCYSDHECNYIDSDLDFNETINSEEIVEAKQSLQKQIELKRTLSSDCSKNVDCKTVDSCLKKTEVEQLSFSDKSKLGILRYVQSDTGVYHDNESSSKFCSVNSHFDLFGSKPQRTINIDRCLQWTYKLSKYAWLNYNNSLTLLKRKYPVLKILFKRDAVIILEKLNPINLEEIQRNYLYMASSSSSSKVNDSTDHFVDPKVVSMSKTLMSNAKGKVGTEKVFSKTKFKSFKQSKNKTSHTVAKSKHDLNFKLKLKEACKPKPKTMQKNSLIFNVNKCEVINKELVSEESVFSRNTENDDNVKQDSSDKEFKDVAKQLCTGVYDQSRSSAGSPEPPHLEKEYMGHIGDGYRDTEMEILKMNDFEIEICRDDISESEGLNEVLDMRTGIRHLDIPFKMNQPSASHLPCERGEAQTEVDSESVHLVSEKSNDNMINKLSTRREPHIQGENEYPAQPGNIQYGSLEVEVNKDTESDVNSSLSPSPIVIKNVCSLNQAYNKISEIIHNETNVYNQRILEMLDGEIFDTHAADPKPLDLAKSVKQSEGHFTYDSDETFIYSDASDGTPDVEDEAHLMGSGSNELSPRMKALQSTKHVVTVSDQESPSHDSCSETSSKSGQKVTASGNVCKNAALSSLPSHKINENGSVENKDKLMDAAFSYTTELYFLKTGNVTELESKSELKLVAEQNIVDVKRKKQEGVGNADCVKGNVQQPTMQDIAENDGGGLVINETQIESVNSEMDTTDRQSKSKSGKSPSFVRNLGKSKELKDFMTKEKERRKSLVKDNKRSKPLKLNREKGSLNEGNVSNS